MPVENSLSVLGPFIVLEVVWQQLNVKAVIPDSKSELRLSDVGKLSLCHWRRQLNLSSYLQTENCVVGLEM
jgi:hypothetical protein